MPGAVDALTPGQLVAALNGAEEDRREAFRVALMPRFLSGSFHGRDKSGKSLRPPWAKFLRDAGLAPVHEKPKPKKKPRDVASIYAMAERIKRADQKLH